MKAIVKIMLICMSFSFAACSTVAGAGKDITSAAEWSKEKMGGK